MSRFSQVSLNYVCYGLSQCTRFRAESPRLRELSHLPYPVSILSKITQIQPWVCWPCPGALWGGPFNIDKKQGQKVPVWNRDNINNGLWVMLLLSNHTASSTHNYSTHLLYVNIADILHMIYTKRDSNAWLTGRFKNQKPALWTDKETGKDMDLN